MSTLEERQIADVEDDNQAARLKIIRDTNEKMLWNSARVADQKNYNLFRLFHSFFLFRVR